MSCWEVIDTGTRSAEENMHLDAQLLSNADKRSQPVLHLYEWEGKSATYGYFTNPAQFLNLENIQHCGLSLARRPTGGGITFHLWDMAFSVFVPSSCPEFSQNTLDNYAFVNAAVLNAVKEFLAHTPPLFLTLEDLGSWDTNCHHFCMAKPTKYDVMWEGKKIAGAAQRKTRQGFLHQGTIALSMPSLEVLSQLLLPGTKVFDAMQAYTCPLLGKNPTEEEIQGGKKTLRTLLATHLGNSSDILRQIN